MPKLFLLTSIISVWAGWRTVPGCRSELATFTRVLSPSAQTTVASSMGLLELSGAMAVRVPLAKGPRLVGDSGPLAMAVGFRNPSVKRWLFRRSVSPIRSAELTACPSHGPILGRCWRPGAESTA
jgi:hypothetical protein